MAAFTARRTAYPGRRFPDSFALWHSRDLSEVFRGEKNDEGSRLKGRKILLGGCFRDCLNPMFRSNQLHGLEDSDKIRCVSG